MEYSSISGEQLKPLLIIGPRTVFSSQNSAKYAIRRSVSCVFFMFSWSGSVALFSKVSCFGFVFLNRCILDTRKAALSKTQSIYP